VLSFVTGGWKDSNGSIAAMSLTGKRTFDELQRRTSASEAIPLKNSVEGCRLRPPQRRIELRRGGACSDQRLANFMLLRGSVLADLPSTTCPFV
jgi:hypothetical protein